MSRFTISQDDLEALDYKVAKLLHDETVKLILDINLYIVVHI